MRYIRLALVLGMLVGFLWPQISQAVYLRVETIGIPDGPTSIWEWLRIRRPARVKLPVGTKLVVNASAYASSPYQTDSSPCFTGSGTRVRQGVVASNSLPMGTLLDINGEPFIVEDSMNARYGGNYLDIWFPSTSQALEFGRRKLEITVVGYGEPGQVLALPSPSPVAVAEAAESEERSIRTERDLGPVIAETARSWWQQVVERIGARLTGNVDRFDVDCGQL